MPSMLEVRRCTRSRLCVCTEGSLARRVHSMVIEWADLHRAELMDNWERARQGQPLVEIAPLD